MPFTLGFDNEDYENYTGLVDEEDVYEAIKEEVQTSIESMGSEGYELIWPDLGPNPSNDSLTALRERIGERAFSRAAAEAHSLGVEATVTRIAPEVHKELWVRYPATENGAEDISVNGRTETKLPDGTVIWLKEEY